MVAASQNGKTRDVLKRIVFVLTRKILLKNVLKRICSFCHVKYGSKTSLLVITHECLLNVFFRTVKSNNLVVLNYFFSVFFMLNEVFCV